MTAIPSAPLPQGFLSRALDLLALCRAIAVYGDMRRVPKSLLARLGLQSGE